jgi:hypothetical protein
MNAAAPDFQAGITYITYITYDKSPRKRAFCLALQRFHRFRRRYGNAATQTTSFPHFIQMSDSPSGKPR